jgi:hypothetical protein
MSMIRHARIAVLAATLALVVPALAAAQESPFVPEKLSRILNNEISGDRAFNVVRLLTPFHRIMGSRAFLDAAEVLAVQARTAGLENIRIVKQKFEGGLSWDAKSARLWLIEPEETKLADFADVAVSLAVFSRTAHAEAELIDIGRGAGPADFQDIDVAGKIVLTTAAPGLAVRTAVWDRGALGVVSCASIHPEARFDTPDQIAYIKVPAAVPAGKTPPWAFMISAREYGRLQDLLRRSKSQGRSVRVRADIETEIREPAEQAFLWAELEGSEIHDQDIVLTAHLDEESTSANDNGSGCASVLEIGRAIQSLVRQGRIGRPKRDIVFWWPNEHTSEYQYLREHPEARKNWLAAVNQDMVGARQSQGSRVQHIIRTPSSLPSYLSDMIESIAEFVILSNSGFLAAEEGGLPQPFAKPILSFLGSRERYDAMVVPHSGGSDQEVFCEGVIGVPGVALINNPDAYIHSSDDDLPNIDRTQLKRNAFLVAAATLFVANAGDAEVPLLTAEVFSRAVRRLGKDLSAALAMIREKKSGSFAQSYREARNLMDQAAEREAGALASIRIFAQSGGRNAAALERQIASLRALSAGLTRELAEAYFLASGVSILPAPSLTPLEREMAARVPVNADSLDEYFSRRGWSVGFPGLHPIMAKECFCFVDGKRSYLDIFRAVQAEALSAGEYYYGRVAPEAVKALLDQAVATGALKLKIPTPRT